MEAGRFCARVLGKLDPAAFPVVVAGKHGLELRGVCDASEAEGDCASLLQLVNHIPQEKWIIDNSPQCTHHAQPQLDVIASFLQQASSTPQCPSHHQHYLP